jgi:hypothetical protein
MKAIKTWAAAAALLVSAPAFAGWMTPSRDGDGDGDKRHVTWKSGDDVSGSVIHDLLSDTKRGSSKWENSERDGSDRKESRREDAKRGGDSDGKRKSDRSDDDDDDRAGSQGDDKKKDKDKDKDKDKPGSDAKPEDQPGVPPVGGPAAEEPSDGDAPRITFQALNVEPAPEVVSRVDEPATLGLLGLAGLAALATRRRTARARRT